ncbi:hypothetical protein PY247_10600 [Acinetobacter proteolyticus]|nr:hypothetical protein [Acinetobacter proteolyticus]WEI20122.1 hypothetical protein PY247_10600 [Acinetobacter proteolyticus]
MDRSWIFKTKSNKIGFIEHSNDHFLMYLHHSLLPKYHILDFSNCLDPFFVGEKEEINEQVLRIYVRDNLHEEINEILEVFDAGCFYPRIAKDQVNFNYVNNESLKDFRAFKNIAISLDDIANYVELDEQNLETFSHKIRELLIISCTEVEHLLKKLLTENNFQTNARDLGTTQYYKCKEILKLDKYNVVLKKYQNFRVFSPFENWTNTGVGPTKSLPWYNAYNLVKHNRGDEFTEANLEHLLNAISAIHILLEAQYGKHVFQDLNSLTDDKSPFQTTSSPEWDLSEICVPKLKIGPMREVLIDWIGTKAFFDHG